MLGTCETTRELDIASAPGFRSDLYDTIERADTARVVIDCSDVTFMDSSAYYVLVDANHYATARGLSLVVHGLSRSCARLIQLCDPDRELRVEP